MDETVRAFNELVGELDYSMLIVVAAADGQQAGCLVGFATQCSIDPPRFLVFLSDKNRTLRIAERSGALLVHFVPAEELGLVELFGTETGDEVDKFARCRWRPGPEGLPLEARTGGPARPRGLRAVVRRADRRTPHRRRSRRLPAGAVRCRERQPNIAVSLSSREASGTGSRPLAMGQPGPNRAGAGLTGPTSATARGSAGRSSGDAFSDVQS